jgi:hypothetical protein
MATSSASAGVPQPERTPLAGRSRFQVHSADAYLAEEENMKNVANSRFTGVFENGMAKESYVVTEYPLTLNYELG